MDCAAAVQVLTTRLKRAARYAVFNFEAKGTVCGLEGV
jgi:hypothetical protein